MIVAANDDLTVPRIFLAAIPDFNLGRLRVRPARRQVCPSAGDCRELEPRVMQVLVALARAGGEVVSRDELIDLCWDGRIVGDDSINRCMVALRRLAKSIKPTPFEIETVARVGYCLTEVGPDDGEAPRARAGATKRRFILPGIAAVAVAAALALAFFLPGPRTEPAPLPPQVQLASIRLLSAELPAATAESFREELTATLQAENALMVVAPVAGRDAPPRHSLSATVQKSGDLLRFTLHLRNPRSGASLWSQTFERPAERPAVAQRLVAESASRVLRCGLAGAGPSLDRLSDQVLYLWLQYCAARWGGSGASAEQVRDAAQRVTAAAPDFAPGWGALAFFAMQIDAADPAAAAPSRAQAAAAAREALRLDPANSEAYAAMAQGSMIDLEFVQAERYFQRAFRARPTDCGCEHHVYGLMLASLGRTDDAIRQFRRAQDIQPLPPTSYQIDLAAALLADGQDEGRRIIERQLILRPGHEGFITEQIRSALWTGRHDEALGLLLNPENPMPANLRAALVAAFRALKSGNEADRRRAAAMLADLARNPNTSPDIVTTALGALGENRAALASTVTNFSWSRGLLFEPSFAGVRNDPAFAALVERLGMVRYWRQTGRRPDVCRERNAPAFCRTL